jgi:outer membrane lipoprotein carrier protein
LPAIASAGPARDRLDAFLSDLTNLQAEFRQVLVDDDGRAADTSTGTVYLQRPGRFRWDYRDPYPQLIVADGEKIWLFDPDLSQVTVRSQQQSLGSTPAALLASDRPVDESFLVTELPLRDDGSAWLALKPRDTSSSFEGIQVGFDANGLTAMELKDGFGQTTRLEFSDIQRNPELASDLFRFTPPDGVDVIQGQ